MNPTMPPPPPRNPNPKPSSPPPPAQPEAAEAAIPDTSMTEADGSTNPSPSSSMPPPPPPRPSPQVVSEPAASADGTAEPSPSVSGSSADDAGDPGGDAEMTDADAPPEQRQQQPRPRPPYAIPDWSAAPGHPFFLEVIKSGQSFEKLDVSKKGAYMFGRIDLCDFVLEHPTISRFHAVLQFRNDGDVFLYDLGSTHGSSINKTQIKKKVYTKIHVGDIIRFGQSSRLYLFQGPSELMPPEKDMQKRRDAKIRQDMLDREASLARAKTQAALAEGISWGMSEDAPEELGEDEADEITWQTYTGQLTDRQQKTRGKIIKRMEKVANMKKEIDAIRVKDISQGGLTQGQQTQIARNEQRISQIMEELENLEETLNDSIQESLGARTGKPKRGSHKANIEEEVISDDDDFFDRTKKKPSNQQSNGQQSVETADSLLEKKDIITNDIEGKKKLLEEEKNKLAQRHDADLVDDLDAYMSGLSSQLVHDNISKIQKELSDLQAELDKVVYLLKVADPMGEAAHKRDLKPKETNLEASNDDPKPESKKQEKTAENKTSAEENSKDSCSTKTEVDKPAEEETDVSSNQENASKPAFSIPKPQWLGDKRIMQPEENCIKEANTDAEEPDNFVDYKDRKTILSNSANEKDIEEAAPGLILRKRKSADQSAGIEPEPSSVESETSAADAVALLLKHTRGLQTSEEMENEKEPQASKRKGKKSKQKRVLGPARPDFLEAGPDCETWVPPEGQTGDGRTSLNERLGY